MTLIIDPAKVELRFLRDATSWRAKRVLEIGCGDGRLTRRLASLAPSRIDALDPDPAKVRLARDGLPSTRKRLIRYGVGQAQHLKFPSGTFDIVIFSWAL